MMLVKYGTRKSKVFQVMSEQTDTDSELNYKVKSCDEDEHQPSTSKSIPKLKATCKGAKTRRQAILQGKKRTRSGIPGKLKAVDMWKHFIRHSKKPTEDFVLVECIHCDKKIPQRKSSTSGIRSHLLYNHPDQYEKVVTQEMAKKMKVDVYVDEFVEAIKKQDEYEKDMDELIPTGNVKLEYSTYDSSQSSYDLDCMMFIVKCNLPFSIVDSEGFKEYTYSLNNKVTVKHSTTYLRFQLPLLHNHVKSLLNNKIYRDSEYLTGAAITTDLWTSRTNERYTSYFLHYISDDFELSNVIISCELFEGLHTSIAIDQKLDQICESIPGYSNNWETVVVYDAADNINAAIPGSMHIKKSLLCIDHVFNLVLQKAVARTDGMKELFEKFTNLVSFLHQSSLSEQQLEAVCKKIKVKYVKPIAPVATRWNSHQTMLLSLIRLEPALMTIKELGTEKLTPLIPDEADWTSIKRIEPILAMYQSFSETLSSDLSPTIHLVCPSIFEILVRVRTVIENVAEKNKLLEEFAKNLNIETLVRFEDYACDNKLYATAHLLDPFFKGSLLRRSSKMLYCQLREEIIRDNTSYYDLNPIKSENLMREELQEIDQLILEPTLKTQKQFKTKTKSSIELEFEVYESMPRPGNDSKQVDILNWWKINSKTLPILSNLARQVLCVPASSATSEMLFLASGHMTDRRNHLDPENVNMIVYIQQNLKYVAIGPYFNVLETTEDNTEQTDNEKFTTRSSNNTDSD